MTTLRTKETTLFQLLLTKEGRPEDIVYIGAADMDTALAAYRSRPSVTKDPFCIRESRLLDIAEMVEEEAVEEEDDIEETRYFRDDCTVSMLAHPAFTSLPMTDQADYAAHVMHRYLHDGMRLAEFGQELSIEFDHTDPGSLVEKIVTELARVYKDWRGDAIAEHADTPYYRDTMSWTLGEKRTVLSRMNLDTASQLGEIIGRKPSTVTGMMNRLRRVMAGEQEAPNAQEDEGTQEAGTGTD